MSNTTDKGWVATARLLHYGVKGMRWGVSRSRAPTAVTVSQKGRKRLKAVGGENQSASEDAVRTKTFGQVAKKSGHQALSNEQLREYTNRLNLEQNAKRLEYSNKNVAQKFVSDLLKKTGPAVAQQAASDVATKQVKKKFTERERKVGFQ